MVILFCCIFLFCFVCQYQSSDWKWRLLPKWRRFCRVGCQTPTPTLTDNLLEKLPALADLRSCCVLISHKNTTGSQVSRSSQFLLYNITWHHEHMNCVTMTYSVLWWRTVLQCRVITWSDIWWLLNALLISTPIRRSKQCIATLSL